jgi:uncharacterized ferredoxin-like protein
MKAVEIVAELMALAARTAPKARGNDTIETKVIAGEDLKILAEEMRRHGEAWNSKFFLRDAGNLDKSDACVLIGSQKEGVVDMDCGGCGFETCKEMLKFQEHRKAQRPFQGPNCIIKIADLGIALGSAVKTASLHNLDNRIMYTAGVCALSLGWLKNCSVAYGIPLKASGKNLYFDRQN